MNVTTQTWIENIHSGDAAVQNAAFSTLIEQTEQPVDWAYDVWDGLVADLRHRDNHVRAIAAQLLCNLAKSDPDQRMLRDFDALLAVTKDERFVTARHCLQALWKIGLSGDPQRARLLDGLETRFRECAAEKNGTLIRFDIVQDMRTLYDHLQDERIRARALALIASETDLKYRKKYAGVWRKA